MSFEVSPVVYDRFMGRYSRELAPLFADFAGIEPPGRVVDVGCGPGALTSVLVSRLGPQAVTAIDPSEPFVNAVREKYPDVEVYQGNAENMPFETGSFDRALAQLVVHHMADPVAGVSEMGRVVGGGVVAACVWDHGGGRSPHAPFWKAVRSLDPSHQAEAGFPGSREGELGGIFRTAGLKGVEEDALDFDYEVENFNVWWEPFPLGVGPAGRYIAELEPERRSQLRGLCRDLLPSGPFVLPLRVWAARGTASG
jgi:SAM-dependent methyltransferase